MSNSNSTNEQGVRGPKKRWPQRKKSHTVTLTDVAFAYWKSTYKSGEVLEEEAWSSIGVPKNWRDNPELLAKYG